MISIARPNPSDESFEAVARGPLCWANHVTELCEHFEVASRMRGVPRFVHREGEQEVHSIARRGWRLLRTRNDTKSAARLQIARALFDECLGEPGARMHGVHQLGY